MGLLDRWRRVGPDDRSPKLGLKYKDLSVLRALQQQGADLSQPRHVLHYCYFPSREQAAQAAVEIAKHHWIAEVREPPASHPGSWLLLAQRHSVVLTPNVVRGSTDLFEKIAADFGGAHDGWEASG
jgi:hypothetical protein